MSETVKSLHFIEQLIEEDLVNNITKREELRFRFPPEPNGYLHIGHAKAICLNFGLGQRYNAPVNLRFDDTNPAKEEQHYIDAIKRDVEWLGFEWDKVCYASDYFEQLYQWALLLIEKGMAYVDAQSSEEMAKQKGTPTQAGTSSPYRDTSVAENLALFEQMKQGQLKEGTHVLRAKIDMSSSNMLMRDPIIYRIVDKPHHRTADQWKIYPMYDWTHGQSDYIEQVSHSFCTLEFAMHRELYEWFLSQIDSSKGVKPKQREFARLNLNYTVMSKRKLADLITDGVVADWDDPRMPTISGLRRRGYTPTAIRNFCETIGIAKRENQIDMALLEYCIREDLNKKAPRVMGVLNPVKLIITNYPDDEEEWLEAENNPEEEVLTYRKIPFSKEIYIEQEDFREEANRKFFRLKLGGEVRLKNAYIIKAEQVKKDAQGNVIEIHAQYDPKSKSGSGTEESLRKVKGTLHWVSVKHAIAAQINLYDRLFNEPEPDQHPDGMMACINEHSHEVITAYVEPSLENAPIQSSYQFQRMGYFCVDKSSSAQQLVFNKTVGLKDTWSKQQNK